jgi:hypothetical protein
MMKSRIVTFDNLKLNLKGKAIPLQVWAGPEGSRKLRLPEFKTVGNEGGKGVKSYAPAAFSPRK